MSTDGNAQVSKVERERSSNAARSLLAWNRLISAFSLENALTTRTPVRTSDSCAFIERREEKRFAWSLSSYAKISLIDQTNSGSVISDKNASSGFMMNIRMTMTMIVMTLMTKCCNPSTKNQ